METSESAQSAARIRAPEESNPGAPDAATGAAGPPRSIDLWAAARKRPLVVILCGICFLAVGVILGLQKAPEYAASTRMVVQIGTSEPTALGGIAEAVVVEAASFSRAIESNAVIAPTAAALGLTLGEVAGHVSATPVAQSGDITVTATGSSSAAAVSLANAVSNSLSRYVELVSNPGQKPTVILAEYERAGARVRTLQRRVSDLAAHLGSAGAESVPLGRLEARLQAAILRRETLKMHYQSALLAPTTRLTAVVRPTSASSNRSSKVALLGVVGLIFGIVVGLVVVTLDASRAARRALAV
jgi:capsular polysaccharide biosynthesis protein